MDESRMILYDGYCRLCSRTVAWVKRNDRKGRFSFRPLQADPLLSDPFKPEGQAPRQGPNPAPDPAPNPDSNPVSEKDREEAPEQAPDEETVVLLVGERRYERSTAAIRIAMGLRFPWPLLAILLIVPRFLRDAVYDVVARNRTRWFGTHTSCYLPED